MKQLLAFCESNREYLVRTIERLVELESPTLDKAAADRCGEAIARLLADLGGAVTAVASPGCGSHLRARFGDGGPRLLLLGHYDTVWPVGQLQRMPLVRQDGRLHGPGTFDMKGGIAIGLLALRALAAVEPLSLAPVTCLLTSDEETGSKTSRHLIEDEARGCAAVLVLEPALPGGAVKTSRKGCGEFEIRVYGVAAHAGIEPEKGANAILELAGQVLEVERLQDPSAGTTLTVTLASGGTRPNVVPDEARATVDARAASAAEAARVSAAVRALAARRPGARVEVTGGFDRPPLERTPAVARLFQIARDVAGEMGDTLTEGATGGGSDGNFTAALGVPTLDGLGAIGDGAHAAHEHVVLDALPRRAALVAALIRRLQRASL
jgi:glutamate carboxypeptidase